MNQPARKLAEIIPLHRRMRPPLALPAGDGIGGERAAMRRLFVLLAISAALHGIVLWLAPGPVGRFSVEVPKTLTVQVVVPPPPPTSLEPARPPEKPLKTPARAHIAPQAEPEPSAATEPPESEPVPTPAPVLALPANSGTTAAVAPPAEPAPKPVAVTAPSFSAAYLSNPAPAYPIAARRRGQEGVVLVEALVSESGLPKEVRLGKSSGAALLDEAAIQAVKGWKFTPARQGERAVAAWVAIPIRFKLDGR
jgi:periplasmic protein TonB